MKNLTINQILDKYRINEFDIVEWNKAFIDVIKQKDKLIKSWTFFDERLWLDRLYFVIEKHPKEFDKLIGVPVGIKDVFNTFDMPTCMGSPLWKDFTPGNDARVVHNVKFQGGIIAGKTVTAEFAVHSPNETRNPWNLDYSPGTSSSGSAAAVAAGMIPLSIGTQTAGSIIRPASYCGIYGFKPSFGTLPRTGVLKTTDTLDSVGLFATNIDDCKLLFDVMRVKGLDYPYVHRYLENTNYQKKINSKWKVGIVTNQHKVYDNYCQYVKKSFDETLQSFSLNNEIELIQPEFSKLFNEVHQIQEIIYHKALSYYFKKEFENKTLISPIMYDIISAGNKITSEEYQSALEKQSQLAYEIDKLFNTFDILISPSTAGYAPRFGNVIDPPDTCLIWSMCGLPVINVPLFEHNNMPWGLQIIARKYCDYKLIDFCKYGIQKLNFPFFCKKII